MSAAEPARHNLPELRSSEWSCFPTGQCFELTDETCVFEVLRVRDDIRGTLHRNDERGAG